MKTSSKDQIAGKLHEVKGAVKAEVGKLTGQPALGAEGRAEGMAGTIRKKIGQLKRFVGR